jgi:hypothetical protein
MTGPIGAKSSRFRDVADSDSDLRFPIWAYVAVGIAAVLAVLWLVQAVLGALAGLVQLIIIVVLAMAVIGWAVNRQSEGE